MTTHQSILEADKSSKEYRKNWARLIQKIGACPKCRGIMQIISFIEDREVIKTILKHHPHLSLGCLPSVVKIRNTGREEPVCPDEP